MKPLDKDLILSLVAQIPRIITVEDNIRQGGFGSAVLETLADNGLTQFEIVRLGIDDVFVSHGPQKLLRGIHKIDAPAIVAAARQMMPRSHLQATATKA